ncbi:hypothetical protein V1512DRAFT_266301 [Lipomyces arxii]|uniref:uncharacterized protein n=1 Tax=Lipomyces arxii TaxID=56418 RepID=UPI0034CECB8C
MPVPRFNLVTAANISRLRAMPCSRIRFVRRTYATQRTIPPESDTTLLEEERDIKDFLSQFPGATKFYTNPDNSVRIPSDEEFISLLKLRDAVRSGELAPKLSEYFKLNSADREAYVKNLETLKEKIPGDFDEDEGVIVDKIPVKDHNGNIDWQVLRRGKKEGWEEIMYYGYVPVVAFIIFYLGFMHKDVTKHWALEELRLQTEEKYLSDQTFYKNLTPEQQVYKDWLVVEKILAGNYDELVSH